MGELRTSENYNIIFIRGLEKNIFQVRVGLRSEVVSNRWVGWSLCTILQQTEAD